MNEIRIHDMRSRKNQRKDFTNEICAHAPLLLTWVPTLLAFTLGDDIAC